MVDAAQGVGQTVRADEGDARDRDAEAVLSGHGSVDANGSWYNGMAFEKGVDFGARVGKARQDDGRRGSRDGYCIE